MSAGPLPHSPPPRRGTLAALVARRRLLAEFIVRDIRSRYFGTVTGALWSLLHPVAQLAIFAFVWGMVFKVKFPQLNDYSIVTFIAVAIWPWTMFQEGVQRAMASIPGNADLIRKVAFPRELLPIAGITATFLVQLAGYVLVMALLYASGEKLHLRGLPLVLLSLVNLFLCATALGFVLSALHTVVRDVEHAFAPVFMLLFYATPVLYPLEMVPEGIRRYMLWNPLAVIITRLREAWLGGALPAGEDALAFAVALAAVFLARAFFLRIAPYFEEFA